MKPDFYNVGDRFRYEGTIYTIKSVTENALEVASIAEQSLWVSFADLGLNCKSSLFIWQHKFLVAD